MSHELSPATQHAIIGDGLAIGCVRLGVAGITPKKQYLGMAFSRALHDLPARSKFPQVRPDAIHNILQGRPRRATAHVVWRRGERWWLPEFGRGFTADEAGELAAQFEEGDGIPAGVWDTFGRTFVEALQEPESRGVETICWAASPD